MREVVGIYLIRAVGLGFQCYSALGLGASSLRTEEVLCWNIYCASYT